MVKKLKMCLLVGLMVFVLGGVNANAESFSVQNEKDLRNTIMKAKSNDTIILDNNITLHEKLNIDRSLTLDLNKKTVVVAGDSSSIIVGKKEPKSKKERALDYLTLNSDLLSFNTKHKFSYDDTIDVTIKNGTIVHSNGLTGKNGIENSWFNFCGNNGTTPSETIGLESGKLSLDNISVYAGNGGNGGNGAAQSSVHIIYGGGIGGRGGFAGDGGNAIKVLRKECKLNLSKTVTLKAGKAGKVGKNSSANPNYWIYKPLELKVSAKAKTGKKVAKDFAN